MKKMLAALLAALLLFASCALAEGPMTKKPIVAQEYTWKATFGEMRKKQQMYGMDFRYSPYSPRLLADVNSYIASWLGESASAPKCFEVRIPQTCDVGGFEAEPSLWFVYPQPGAKDNDAQLYAVEYRFYDWDGDVSRVFDKLGAKYEKQYGEPYYEGSVISEALGELPLSFSQLEGYYQNEADVSPRYKVWRSSENGSFLALKLYRQGRTFMSMVVADESAEALFAEKSSSLSGL